MKTLVINPEVEKALKEGKPVVALESTIIAHGMPYPENKETAMNVEGIVRSEGAVPATIAVIDGKLKVGLSPEEIDRLGREGSKVPKASRRDLPYLVSKGLSGATTVAATSLIASMAGIAVFATGGIGGVHRGAESTFDISADLEELSRTKVAVVCAGAKAILDLGKTLEVLETKGVEVVGYGTDVFPAFYSAESDFRVNHRLDTPEEIAALMRAKWNLGLEGGILVANPIPKEHSLPKAKIEAAITEALTEMNRLGITGNKTTPYLLAKVKDLTGGESLEANIALVYNNARLAAKIAKAYAELKK
ncbi:MAG TPA: pseudouridine-5'-phosphate glycosidase [Acholeplasmataceae bacterium]|nr:pseudouridine-5'-phosphate glycosidase [Acholeplasmataceae bacterium]